MTTNSENEVFGFRDRIAHLVGSDEPFAWAKRVGIPSATFDRIWNGGSVPKAETLLRIARACRVSVDWLLTGMDNAPANSPNSSVAQQPVMTTDHRLIGRLTEGISRVFAETGQAAALHQIAERAAAYHDRIVATTPDPDDRLVEAGACLAELRAELRAAAANPTETKHSA